MRWSTAGLTGIYAAVTGLSRSGKTAFITALVNQLLNIHTGARLPLLSAAREERLLGVKRVPQRDFGIPRFTYDEGLAQLYGQPPMWPTRDARRERDPSRAALPFNDSLLRHFKDTSTLYLEIVDYPGVAARFADAGAGLSELDAADDRTPAGTACRVVGPLAAALRRAGSAGSCRRGPSGRHRRRTDGLSARL